MVSKQDTNGKRITLTKFQKGANGKYVLSVMLDSKEESYQVGINDQHGIFAVDLPRKLALKLREYPVNQSKALVGAIKSRHRSS